MRIGIDARLAYRRGVGTYSANLVLALSRVDPYNDYWIFGAPTELKKAVTNRRFRFSDPQTESESRFARRWESHPAWYEQFWLPSRLFKYELDLLHYTDNSATMARDIPYVVTVHDTLFLRPLTEAYPRATLKQKMLDLYKKLLVPSTARHARAVLTVSEFSKQGIVKDLKVPAERVFVTPEGVDAGFYHPPVRRGRGARETRKRKVASRILAHGADDERKNLFNILKAVSLVQKKGKRVTLDILGMEEADARRTGYARWVKEWGMESSVRWMGHVSKEKVRESYHKADVFLYVSRWEGFGLPILEAFACGVPVLSSNKTALPEVAGGAACLVDPEKSWEIAEELDRLLRHPSLRAEWIKKGYARAKQFSWERTAQATLDVYRKVLLEMEYDTSGKRIETHGEGSPE